MALTKLTQNLIDGTIVTSVNSQTGAVTLETGTDWVSTIQTSNFTAAAGKGYFVNTTSQVLYVTLPVGVVGMEITIQDYAGTFATNKVILNANGSEKIQGSALEGEITTNNATAVLIYQDATKGWTSQDVTLIPATIPVEYLVVAGGGSGGGGAAGSGGGGGAGGYLTNYNGTAIQLLPATLYAVTVGAGGAAGGLAQPGNNGNNSTFNNITSTGGGRGGYDSSTASSTGGSGGGGSGNNNAGQSGASGNTPSTTPSQGNNGGNGVGTPIYQWGGGGGGGATGVGVTATGNSPGNGGAGNSNLITGTLLTYAGGGGGGSWTSGTANGSGGAGGGGAGGKGAGSAGANGAANTGGGSGGGGQDSSGGIGGDGIVILRYPNSYTISGLSGTTTTVGTDLVTTFTNAGTGNIQFN
jgi:hypothetical protein